MRLGNYVTAFLGKPGGFKTLWKKQNIQFSGNFRPIFLQA